MCGTRIDADRALLWVRVFRKLYEQLALVILAARHREYKTLQRGRRRCAIKGEREGGKGGKKCKQLVDKLSKLVHVRLECEKTQVLVWHSVPTVVEHLKGGLEDLKETKLHRVSLCLCVVQKEGRRRDAVRA